MKDKKLLFFKQNKYDLSIVYDWLFISVINLDFNNFKAFEYLNKQYIIELYIANKNYNFDEKDKLESYEVLFNEDIIKRSKKAFNVLKKYINGEFKILAIANFGLFIINNQNISDDDIKEKIKNAIKAFNKRNIG